MGPAINENQLKTDLSYVDIGKAEGARLKCGGNRLDKGEYQNGYFMEPTVFVDVDPKMRIAQEEIFGPVVSIIPCDDLEDAIEIANGIEYGLSSALYTKDVNRAFTAMRDLDAGITYINAPTIGAEVHLPFGGVKATGNGHREGGLGAIDFYSEWKVDLRGLFRSLAEGADRSRGLRDFTTESQSRRETYEFSSLHVLSVTLRCSLRLQNLWSHSCPSLKAVKSPPPPPRQRPLCHPRPGLHRRRGHQAGPQGPRAQRRRSQYF